MIKDDKFYSHNGILICNGDRILGKYDTQYEVTVTTDGNGTAAANPSRGHHGDTITMNVVPNAGYELDKHTVNGVAIQGNTFNIISDSLVHTTFKDATSYDIKGKHEPYSTQPQYWADHPAYDLTINFNSCITIGPIYDVNELDWSSIGHPGAQRYVVTKGVIYLDNSTSYVDFKLTDTSYNRMGDNIPWATVYRYTTKGTHKLGLISDSSTQTTYVYIDKQLVTTTTSTFMKSPFWTIGIPPSTPVGTQSKITHLYIETIADYDEALHYALAL